jgi:hypothetical protein
VAPRGSTTVQAITASLLAFLLVANPTVAAGPFHFSAGPVPEQIAAGMHRHSWREGCPTPIADLVYLRLSHIGFDGAAHEGELVVHKALSDDVVAIFRSLFEMRFPIEKMRLIDDYQGDDDVSMADNNSSGFNCRFVAGRPGVLSKHSEGRAIDINPRINPMVSGKTVRPPNGVEFLAPKAKSPGALREGAAVVEEFTRRGWTWGGTWKALKDYQHFEK